MDTGLNVISTYASEGNKPKQERDLFHEQLQNVIDTLLQNKPLILLGDFHAQIGKCVMAGMTKDSTKR